MCWPATSRPPRTWRRATPGPGSATSASASAPRPGRHRHDHRAVLGAADSIPILCITGQAPAARLHKEDFQAVDIAAIAKPVTKLATTVLEAAQVPGAFQQAFHLMRSGRPGPVLLDLPFDVQMAEIEFDIDTYEPLPVHKPAATRPQVERRPWTCSRRPSGR